MPVTNFLFEILCKEILIIVSHLLKFIIIVIAPWSNHIVAGEFSVILRAKV